MIAPDTKVSILDIDEQEVIQDTIENVYIKFAHLVNEYGHIVLDNKQVMISDWTGWTRLLSISKSRNNSQWYRLATSNNEATVSLAGGTTYPAYEPMMRKHGFHGEVLYKYIVLEVPWINDDSHLRVRGLNDEDGIIKQFSPYTIELTQREEYGYSIYTQSGFFNANGIHLLRDTINKETGYK